MRNYKIGVMLDSFRLPFSQAVKKAAEIGADALQISAYSPVFSPAEMSASDRAAAFREIRDSGLSVSAICGDLGGHGFAVAADNPRKIEISKRILDIALEFDTKVVTTHIGVIPADRSGAYGVMQQACYELAEYAAGNGGYFAVETGPETPVVLGQFLDSLNSNGVAVNYDPANLVMVTASDPVAGVHTLKDKIVHTHAKDGIQLQKCDPAVIYNFFAEGGIEDLRLEDYFKELPLGCGNVNIPAWINALDEINYNGYLTIEREVGATPCEDIEAAVRYLKGIMAEK